MNNKIILAGSKEAILQEIKKFRLLHLLDEIIHALNLDNNELAYRFCQWVHKNDYK